MAKMTGPGYTAKEKRQHRLDYTYAILTVDEAGTVTAQRRYVDADVDLAEAILAYPGCIVAWEHDMYHRGAEWCVAHDRRMRLGR